MLRGRGRRYLIDAASALDRAPVEVAIALLLAVAFSVAIELQGEVMQSWVELAAAGLLIFAAAATATLLHALGTLDVRRRWLITVTGAVVVLAYAVLVMDFERLSEVWRAFVLVAAAALWLGAAAAFGGPRATALERVRAVDGRVLLRVFGALLYAGALFAGLALALGAVNTLFELDLDGKIYLHVFGWIFIGLAPWIVIGGLPDYVRPIEAGSAVAGVVHRMTTYLVPPLVALYYLILYAYVVRIIVTGEVPKNLLSPMVLAAGILAVLALFLFEPRTARGGGLRWLRLAPPLFLPLAALGVWAITLRIGQYGWTEFRLFRLILLVVLGALALAGTVQLARGRRFALHVVPLALAAALLLASVGPWNALAVSRRSQQARLAAALTEIGIDPARAVRAPDSVRTVPAEQYMHINSTARYVAQHFGVAALPPALAQHATDRGNIYDLAHSIGLARGHMEGEGEAAFGGRLAEGTAVPMRGATAHRVTVTPERGVTRSGAVTVMQDSMRLLFTVAGQQYTADLGGYRARALPARERMNMLTASQAVLPVLDGTGTEAGTLLVLDIHMVSEDGALRLRRLDGLLLIDER
jgi:hypothetical protein